MGNEIILMGVAVLVIVYSVTFISVHKKNKIYREKLVKIYNREFDPAKALIEIEKEISVSRYYRVNHLLLDKFFALIWLGKWQEAKKVVSRVDQCKYGAKRRYALHYGTLLLKLLSRDTDYVEQAYKAFISNINYSKYWKNTSVLQFLSCLYTLNVEKDYMEYIRLYQELIHGNRIHILNLGVLYLYAGIANYELHNIKESIRNLSRAKVFGEKIFVKKEAENMLQRIQENSCNSEYDKINRMIEESSEQARKEYEEYLLQVLKE